MRPELHLYHGICDVQDLIERLPDDDPRAELGWRIWHRLEEALVAFERTSGLVICRDCGWEGPAGQDALIFHTCAPGGEP